ncbi:MAG: PAS domain S-box protein [Candidatus Acidiferrales bacterium]
MPGWRALRTRLVFRFNPCVCACLLVAVFGLALRARSEASNQKQTRREKRILVLYSQHPVLPNTEIINRTLTEALRASGLTAEIFEESLEAVRRWGIPPWRLPAGSVLAFQEPSFWSQYTPLIKLSALFLVIAAALLLGVLAERRRRLRAQASLASRYELEKHITQFSAQLAASAPERIDLTIQEGLDGTLDFVDADRICWYVVRDNSPDLVRIFSCKRHGVSPSPESVTPEQLPHTAVRLARGETVVVRSLDHLPEEAESDRQFFAGLGVRSLILAPANCGSNEKGILGLSSRAEHRNWTSDLVNQLGVLSNIIGAAVERRRADEARQESEDRFRYLFEQASIGIVLETMEGKLLHVNPAFCSMLGYTENEMLRLRCAEVTHPEDVAADESFFAELREARRPGYQMEKRFLKKDGAQIWAHLSVSLLRRNSGHAPLVVAMVEDITGRKAAMEQLRASEVRLQSTLDVIPSQVAILDEAGTIIAVNASWGEHFADRERPYPHWDVGANFIEECAATVGVNAEHAQAAAERVQALLRSQPQANLLRQKCRTAGGAEIWYQVGMARFEENGAARIVLAYRDVTDVIQTREELAKNQERLLMTQEASHSGTWDWDIVAGTVRWTDDQMFLPSKEEMGFDGDYSRLLDLIHPEDRKELEAAALRAMRGGAGTFSAEFRVQGREGATRWVLGKGKVVRDAVGRPIRMSGINIDITELKQAGFELQNLTRRLIQAQDEERHRISRELHDDIGQRVSLLANELSSLGQDLSTTKPSESQRALSLEMQAQELCSDLHELSHELHSSKLQHLGLRVALRDLCDRIATRNKLEIALQTEGVSSNVPTDVAFCLFRVVQEALQNVVKHSRSKKVTVEVSHDLAKIQLRIEDLGVGFDVNSHAWGIGLTSMRERLHMVGGALKVASSPRGGTRIIAQIPWAQSASASAGAG